VNGGCFTIASGLSCSTCSSDCNGLCMGDVDGSNNFLCALYYLENNHFVDCSSTAQCPAGTACYLGSDGFICVVPC
jgi:hypothetical protein